MPEDANTLSSELIQTLTPTYGTVTRKDQVHYALITTEKFVSTVLQLEFTRQLKFKLVFYNEGKNPALNMAAVSVCFYCDAGQPKLLNILPALECFSQKLQKDRIMGCPKRIRSCCSQTTQKMRTAMSFKLVPRFALYLRTPLRNVEIAGTLNEVMERKLLMASQPPTITLIE